MVKLNEEAFAAINAALPGAARETEAGSSKVSTVSKSKRRGVGAVEEDSTAVGGAELHKRVLQIGSKKRKTSDEEQAESEVPTFGRKVDRREVVSHDALDDDDDNEEEDMGRTAIYQKPVRLVNLQNPVEKLLSESAPKKKKKPGKRERQSSKEKNNVDLPDEKKKEPIQKDVLCGEVQTESNTGNEDQEGSKKRKRRKVRSRQKNIRKDNRSTKPSHLMPGSNDYRGRPLTRETRQRLNLPESKRVSKLKTHLSTHGGNAASTAKSDE